ncbi:hypothetical protein FNV43_RR12774 [Rhamnella rubrinervis]|uniref:U-box domain-containing protein n=1 Tax=Rhamnella rubrinervis TaxID=2594499 RepID=A0A8K0H7Y2_9ROSA|nr:hypothetical protein FNV43_RR12774 [Rhamnella rubrinervis]
MEEEHIDMMRPKASDPNMGDLPPHHFRCPISMEVMKDPVTISTGVTYERKNIKKWFFTYKKKTCPVTMQSISDSHITFTPNHTLKRLILLWQNHSSHQLPSTSTSSSTPPCPYSSANHHEILSLLNTIQSSPFKVTSLKKLRSIVEIGDDETKTDFIRCNGVQILVRIVNQIHVVESSDFITFRACEEALGVLHQLPISEEEEDEEEEENPAYKLLSKPETMRCMTIMLQRASAETRHHTITILRKMAENTDYDWNFVIQDQGVDFFKSLLELVSDEICTKASSCALQVLIEIMGKSKKSRLRAIEAGAVCVLVEVLPDSNRSRCEKILQSLKLLCECAEGRLALVEHGLGIAAISKKVLQVSNVTTKMVVKILWLLCNFHPTERLLDEMLVYGAVKKLLALLHIDARSSTKAKLVNIFKWHGNYWSRYPCFPSEFKDFLGSVNASS